MTTKNLFIAIGVAAVFIIIIFAIPAKTDGEKAMTCPDGTRMFTSKYPAFDCSGDLSVPEKDQVGLWDTRTWNIFDFALLIVKWFIQMGAIFSLMGLLGGYTCGALYARDRDRKKALV